MMQGVAEAKILELESPVHRTLVHVVSIGRAALGADVAAVRLFDDPDLPRNSYVEACRLHLPPHDEAELSRWPRDAQGLFAHSNHLKPSKPRAGSVFQPLRDGGYPDDLYRPIQTFVPVVDDLCTAFSVAERGWCLAAFLRCEGREPFSEDHVRLLEHLQPSIRRSVEQGHRAERNPHATVILPPVSPTDLLARLSATERRVLNHLRADLTERQIAQTLGRSRHTVHVHVKNIYRKVNVSSRRELAQLF